MQSSGGGFETNRPSEPQRERVAQSDQTRNTAYSMTCCIASKVQPGKKCDVFWVVKLVVVEGLFQLAIVPTPHRALVPDKRTSGTPSTSPEDFLGQSSVMEDVKDLLRTFSFVL